MTKEELERKARYESMTSIGGIPIRLFRVEKYHDKSLVRKDDCMSMQDVVEMPEVVGMKEWTPGCLDAIADLPVGMAYSISSDFESVYIWRTR